MTVSWKRVTAALTLSLMLRVTSSEPFGPMLASSLSISKAPPSTASVVVYFLVVVVLGVYSVLMARNSAVGWVSCRR